EREVGEVGKAAEIAGVHAGGIESLLVMRDVVVGVLERPGETLGLQRHDLVARGALGGVKLRRVAASLGLETCCGHVRFLRIYFFLVSVSPVGSHVPPMVRECPRNSAITSSPAVTRTS